MPNSGIFGLKIKNLKIITKCYTFCCTLYYIYCMDITISKHAREQAAKRGITESGIKAIVGSNKSTPTIPSKTDHEVEIFLGIYDGKLWAVPVNIETLNVVTVRRAWTTEEKYYDQNKTD